MTAYLEECDDGRLLLKGSLDFHSVVGLEDAGLTLLDRRTDSHIDLAGVSYSDSSGVALLVRWLGQARARGRQLRFSNVPPQMQCIVRVCALEGLLPIDD